MVQRYTHLTPARKAAAVERIAQNSTMLFTTPDTGGQAAVALGP